MLEILKKTREIRMIEDVFGNPSLPSVISDCYLFFKNGEHLFIDKVYIFDKKLFLEFIEFGELWPKKKPFGGRRIAGYFSASDDRIFQLDDPSRIISSGRSGITFIIESISFVRSSYNCKINEHNLQENCTLIRFEANDVRHIIDRTKR